MIKVGSQVKWKSQSHGFEKEKSGIIVAKIPKGKAPFSFLSDELSSWLKLDKKAYRTDKLGGGAPRDHDSFLVACIGRSKTAKPVLYWPHVWKLEVVERRKKSEAS